jgi:type III pantothenate kinase
MNLIIDIGNSFTKIAIFRNGALGDVEQVNACSVGYFQKVLSHYPGIHKSILSTVKEEDAGLIQFLERNIPQFIHLNERTPLPIINTYKTPETLGKDRIAAVIGANNIFPGKTVLVVDAGTALTFDLLTEEGRYLGGNISPGLKMRFRALHEFTGSLPLSKESDEFSDTGNTTENAIISGVQLGMIYEMDGYIDHMKKKHKDLQVVLTGGDSLFFDKKLKNSIFVNQNLVLIGLNNILEFNAKP